MKISSVMSRDVQLIKPDDTIRSAAALQCGGFDEEDRCWPIAGDGE
jgi:hypothetical protein